MNYYIYQTSYAIEGGYPCYQKNFIELFGIPDFTASEIGFLKTEVSQPKINAFLIGKYELDSLQFEPIAPSTVDIK